MANSSEASSEPPSNPAALTLAEFLDLPPGADNSRAIFLGTDVDPDSGQIVENYAFINYAPGFGRGEKAVYAKGGDKGKPDGGGGKKVKCYAYLFDKAKWRLPEPWVVNPSNTRGLDHAAIFNKLTSSFNNWEDGADGTVGDGNSINILGEGTATTTILGPDNISLANHDTNGANEIYFANIAQPGAVAVTFITANYASRPSQRPITEMDIIFNDFDYDWSAEEDGIANKVDFYNIAMHEVGHGLGMAHVSDDACAEETMWPGGPFAEIIKRTLHTGDIAGIQKLY